MGYSVVHVDDIEPGGRGGAIRFVRPQLGVEAFGINWFEIPPGAEGFEHDESGSDQKEVSVVVSGHWQIDGTEVPVVVSVGARPGAYEARGPF